MNDLNFGSRLWLALVLPFKVLFDGSLAARVASAQSTEPLLPPASPEEPPSREQEAPASSVAAIEPELDTTAALQLLAILQREGRLIDFLQEDMTGFADADIGAAARVVQEGCKRGLGQYLRVAPIRSEAEGDTITLAPGYDARQVRLTGNVTGEPPYRGRLAHHGWRVEGMELPKLSDGYDPSIVAPAEVEM